MLSGKGTGVFSFLMLFAVLFELSIVHLN